MKLSLVLTLALLGAISAHQLEEGALEQEVPDDQAEEELEGPEPSCPAESKSFQVVVPSNGTHTCRYVFVNSCQTFRQAQRYCARCYRGRLASIHSHSTNEQLRCGARARTNRGLVWIGAITYRRFRRVCARWVDRSTWNYANWARRNPRGYFRRCVAMCTNNGRWISVTCRSRLPFICRY
ncbi:bone marrow proteoglycan-like [Carettochelys insculpta]|uniref:bone marrow proteoglycan-like n=1 Tax=Carettochelys insculpta TaxID=44489 RepID=UPI003EB8FE07